MPILKEPLLTKGSFVRPVPRPQHAEGTPPAKRRKALAEPVSAPDKDR